MKRFIVLTALLATFAMTAHAQAAPKQSWELEWTAPTTRIDGTALPVAEIAKYTVSYVVDTGAAQTVDVTPGAAATKTIETTLAARATPYRLSFTMTATDTNGLTGDPSTAVVKTVTVRSAAPGKVTNIRINVNCVNNTCNLIIQ